MSGAASAQLETVASSAKCTAESIAISETIPLNHNGVFSLKRNPVRRIAVTIFSSSLRASRQYLNLCLLCSVSFLRPKIVFGGTPNFHAPRLSDLLLIYNRHFFRGLIAHTCSERYPREPRSARRQPCRSSVVRCSRESRRHRRLRSQPQ